MKWELLDRRLALTGAVFRTEKKNLRTRNLNTDPFILDGEQQIEGLELSASGMITDAWSVFAGASFLDTEYKISRNALEQGQELPLVPEVSANAWTTYVLPFGLTVGLGVQYIDDMVRARNTHAGYAGGRWHDAVRFDGQLHGQRQGVAAAQCAQPE